MKIILYLNVTPSKQEYLPLFLTCFKPQYMFKKICFQSTYGYCNFIWNSVDNEDPTLGSNQLRKRPHMRALPEHVHRSSTEDLC